MTTMLTKLLSQIPSLVDDRWLKVGQVQKPSSLTHKDDSGDAATVSVIDQASRQVMLTFSSRYRVRGPGYRDGNPWMQPP